MQIEEPEESTTHSGNRDQIDRSHDDRDRKRSLLTRAVIATLIVAGVAGYVAATMVGSEKDQDDITSTVNPAVKRLIPQRGDEALRQSRVGVRLNPRYRLVSLTVYFNDRFSDGIEVTSEVVHTRGLGLWQFTPGEDRLVQALSPDTNCAIAVYEPIAYPDNFETIKWCFQVS